MQNVKNTIVSSKKSSQINGVRGGAHDDEAINVHKKRTTTKFTTKYGASTASPKEESESALAFERED